MNELESLRAEIFHLKEKDIDLNTRINNLEYLVKELTEKVLFDNSFSGKY